MQFVFVSFHSIPPKMKNKTKTFVRFELMFCLVVLNSSLQYRNTYVTLSAVLKPLGNPTGTHIIRKKSIMLVYTGSCRLQFRFRLTCSFAVCSSLSELAVSRRCRCGVCWICLPHCRCFLIVLMACWLPGLLAGGSLFGRINRNLIRVIQGNQFA